MKHLFGDHGGTRLLPVALLLALAGCTAPMAPPPGPLVYPRSAQAGPASSAASPERRPGITEISALPSQPAPTGTATRAAAPALAAASSPAGGDEVSMAIEQTPLPMFIQILYGSVLKKPYSIDSAVQARTDLVTFKTSRPVTRAWMEQVAADLLRSYGLSVQDFDGLVRILPDSGTANTSPQLRRGRALPETPEPLRPAFQHVELDVVRSTEALQWLKQIMGTRVNITDDTGRNGLLLSGTQADLRAALDLIQALDQPRMRGRIAKRISPAFSNATEFAARLVEMLTAQGYSASSTMSTSVPTLILPIPAIGSVVVFTSTEAVMEHVLKWAREMDRPPAGSTSNALFTYAVKYADAQDLAKTLGELLGGGGVSGGTAAAAAAGGAPRASSGGGRVVVNNATNTLIFRGSTADEYQQIQTLLRELDRPTKSALIEVVVAELQRNGSQSLGVQWDWNRFGVGAAVGTASIGTGGLALALTNDSQRVKVALNALASTNQARVLSNPKVMARNGETATIQVGQEVPIITSQQSTGTTSAGLFGSTQNILQTVQYRNTGVILKVRPVINSGNRLDLDIQQEVSSAAKTETGVSASPTIATRRVETKLSLRDGSTVLLAGLISRNASNGNAGVPLLKDIPGLGALFGTHSEDTSDTELLVMITPYVINDDYEAEGISDAIQATFGDWAKSIRPSRIDRNAAPASPEAPASDAPVSTQQPAPVATPAPTGTAQVPHAGPAAAREAPADSGITTSRPAGGSTGNAVPPQPATGQAPKTPSGGKPAVPPVKGGTPVEDENVKQEIQKLFEKR